ncbi:uncharacterized protein MYCFIDRAFT_176757 [Pseudocercospora fijiensis CIRAD86]|uniref:Uncharacterized protein n=1 Tax=Pseudocercospora fijiensis (strain CIRAD86) TaxID=383855 RepID=M3AA18_PSEFD|nr:uncharacterized protein MYCFIDRAFT_176757 [Pseudocercospora fijiensis CIRAD86]EME81476.1 hypothetical protein MYCFIDRAFT_176757 [Pseudocercospora fijiensis CIRAD86]
MYLRALHLSQCAAYRTLSRTLRVTDIHNFVHQNVSNCSSISAASTTQLEAAVKHVPCRPAHHLDFSCVKRKGARGRGAAAEISAPAKTSPASSHSGRKRASLTEPRRD